MPPVPATFTDRVREAPALRLLYASALAGRIIGGYKLLALRHRLGLVRDRPAATRRHHARSARRVLAAVLRLQGLMIKIGQSIGSNPTAIPIEYLTVLSRLQDSVPPRPWETIRPSLERSLGGRVQNVFAAFDRCPVGAASLAQVYRARLHDGREVAVKVLYPGIDRLVWSDLRVLRVLLWLDSKFGSYPLEPIYDELAKNVPLEVDLIHEAHAMERMAKQFADDPRIVIPRVVWEHTSRNVLTMEWVDGIKITDIDRLRSTGIDVQVVADLLSDCYARQLLVDGFFHADPHPGNLFALPGNRIAIIDFGLTKEFSPEFRSSLCKLMRGMVLMDIPPLVEAFHELGFAAKHEQDASIFIATAEFFTRITDPKTYDAGPNSMLAINETWAREAKANPFVAIPGDMTLASRVFSLMTGVGVAMGAEPRFGDIVMRYTAPDAALVP